MTFAAAQLAIESRFEAQFSSCPIKYQNVDFEEKANETFAELQIKEGDANRASIGVSSVLHRSTGVISVNIYTAKNTGTVTARGYADLAADVFRDQKFSGITCRSPVVRNIGPREGRYVVNMTVSFYRDETF